MSRPKMEEVASVRRRLHKEERYNLYALPSIIMVVKSRRVRYTRHEARMGKMRNAHKILIRRPEGKKPLGKPRRR